MILNWRKPVVWGLLKAKGSPTPKELKFVRSIERKSPEEIREIQRRRLSELLLHAWEHTEYYRDVLDACGVVRNAKVDLDRFEEIPILTKDTIRSEGPKLKAKVIPQGRKPYVNRTGGSTGEPIEYWQDNYYWAVNVANKLYHFETLGKEIGEAEMKLWGSDRDIYTDTSSWVVKLANFIYNRRVQSCSNMSESDIRDVIAGINKFRPKNIFCYTDVTYTIAEYANHHGLNLHSPAAIVCGGATFHPHMEQSIEKAFGCPAINYYGSREMGVIASQCREKTGLHIVSHSHSVEIIDQHGNSVLDREGDIVVTSLTNYTMPFIRYRIGDRGKLMTKGVPVAAVFPCWTPCRDEAWSRLSRQMAHLFHRFICFSQ